MKRVFDRLLHRALPLPPTDVLTWTRTKSVMFPVFDEALGQRGLYRQKRGMRWAERKANTDGIRRVFHLVALKGAAVLPGWGVSLDFVPHVAAGQVKWHRTFSSAQPDIWCDTDVQKEELSYLHGLSHLKYQTPLICRTVLDKADAFWDQACTLSQLPHLCVKTIELREGPVLSLMSGPMPQIFLAQAFVAARTGDSALAKQAMDQFFATEGGRLSPAAIETLQKHWRNTV